MVFMATCKHCVTSYKELEQSWILTCGGGELWNHPLGFLEMTVCICDAFKAAHSNHSTLRKIVGQKQMYAGRVRPGTWLHP